MTAADAPAGEPIALQHLSYPALQGGHAPDVLSFGGLSHYHTVDGHGFSFGAGDR